jgi:hypothetical protein
MNGNKNGELTPAALFRWMLGSSPASRREKIGPGSAAHHFVLRRARDTGSVIQERPELPAPARMLQLP